MVGRTWALSRNSRYVFVILATAKAGYVTSHQYARIDKVLKWTAQKPDSLGGQRL
jgi:hypothetical protein